MSRSLRLRSCYANIGWLHGIRNVQCRVSCAQKAQNSTTLVPTPLPRLMRHSYAGFRRDCTGHRGFVETTGGATESKPLRQRFGVERARALRSVRASTFPCLQPVLGLAPRKLYHTLRRLRSNGAAWFADGTGRALPPQSNISAHRGRYGALS